MDPKIKIGRLPNLSDAIPYTSCPSPSAIRYKVISDCPIFSVIEKRVTISGIAGTIKTSPITGLAIVRAMKLIQVVASSFETETVA